MSEQSVRGGSVQARSDVPSDPKVAGKLVSADPAVTSNLKAALQDLTAPRLRLRFMTAADAPAFFRLVTSDFETVRFVPWPVQRDVAEAEALIARFLTAMAKGEKYYFVAEDATGAIVAFASLKIREPIAEIGFVVVGAQRRKGYAAELITLLADTAWRMPDVSEVEGLCDVENVGSARAMSSAGFDLDRTLPKYAVHPNVGPEPRDLLRYVKRQAPTI